MIKMIAFAVCLNIAAFWLGGIALKNTDWDDDDDDE